ncbi:MAG: hypothetical protein CL908_20770 [Deltaproteobacteria bacterium]|nr:hypothetical protein [Deltaproteobacteria bacterium]
MSMIDTCRASAAGLSSRFELLLETAVIGVFLPAALEKGLLGGGGTGAREYPAWIGGASCRGLGLGR